MANALTGEFDIVAEFTLSAANRVLAAMHRGERFPHSLSIRVDDTPPLSDRVTAHPGVDRFGDAIGDPKRLVDPPALRGGSPFETFFPGVDPVVNAGVGGRVHALGPPSQLKGIAQLQLSAPTMTLPDTSGTRLTVHMQVIARYFPEPDTRLMPEFVRGEVQVTVSVDRVVSQAGAFVNVSLQGAQLDVAWRPAFASQPLDAADVKVIEGAIRNSIQSSFQPSTAALPANRHMQFKALSAGGPAIAVLLNMRQASGNPGSVSSVFLGGSDDFAFAVGRDFALATFDSLIDDALTRLNLRRFSTSVEFVARDPLFGTVLFRITVTYTVSLARVVVDLQNGRIVLTVDGRAESDSFFLPNFDFTAEQGLTVILGATDAELAPLGDISLNITTGGIAGWLANRFKDDARGILRQRRDQVIGSVQGMVRSALSSAALRDFLSSLMNPTTRERREAVEPQLTYSRAEVTTAGIVLHGSLTVPPWPPPHLEIEPIPRYRSRATDAGSAHDIFHPPSSAHPGALGSTHDYSALRTWIPGGTIRRYTWSVEGQPQTIHHDPDRFVWIDPPDIPVKGKVTALYGLVPICLTVTGTRLSASQAIVEEPVSASQCGWSWPRLGAFNALVTAAGGQTLPDLPLTRATPTGVLEVLGHASPWAAARAASAGQSNLIVHFADGRAERDLTFLTRALGESERTDAAAAILAVVDADQLSRTRAAPGLIYADEGDGMWARLLGVKRRPATVIVGVWGDVVWRREGDVDPRDLAAALRTYLAPGGFVPTGLLVSSVRLGQPSPNFIFEAADAYALTLRKLAGTPVALVFWKSRSRPSIEAVRALEAAPGPATAAAPVVLAINDGDAPDVAKRVAAEDGLSAILVTDPERAIGLAYGVNVWPTTVSIDALGLVRAIRYGLDAADRPGIPGRSGPGEPLR